MCLMIRKNMLKGLLGLMTMASLAMLTVPSAEANARAGRQYYGDWTYNNTQRYHYCYYYYKPVVTETVYTYHYVIYYTARPTYYYYYNPVTRQYWGRYDRDAKGYSMLAEKDRKEKLEDIKEEAFPKPAKMPKIPGAADDEAMLPPPAEGPKVDPKEKK